MRLDDENYAALQNPVRERHHKWLVYAMRRVLIVPSSISYSMIFRYLFFWIESHKSAKSD